MAELIFSGITYPQLLDDIRALLRYEIAQQPAAAPGAEPEHLLTIAQAASLLDVCRQTIHVWQRRGLLPFHKMGKRTYFKKSDLLMSLERHVRSRKPSRSR